MNLPPFPKEPDNDWKGYTLDEMRMQRALVQARMEIQKFKMESQFSGVREKTPLIGGSNSILSRISGAFSMVEYGVFAFRLFRMVSPMFKKKKK